MNNVFFELVVILVLIFLNGLLAMAEIAVVSSRKARLQQQAEEGSAASRAALKLADEPTDFLSTVQVGITLVGVLTGAFGGATIADNFAVWFAQVPFLQPYSQALAIGIVVILITYLTLILGELAPKRIGLENSERVAALVARPMQLLSRLAAPIVRLLSYSTNVALRIIGMQPSKEPPVTEEEIKLMIEQGTRAGVFAEAEQDMVEAIFRLGDRRAGSLMIPRTEVTWLDLEDSLDVNGRKIIESGYARLPVAAGSLDRVVGIVEAKDILARVLSGKNFDLKECMTKPLFVPESMPALRVLELFREHRTQGAFVIDEFGGFQGLVTTFDILESIVGELPDRMEEGGLEILHRPDGTYLLGGLLPIDEFKELLDIDMLPDEDPNQYLTLGGFVMTFLGRIPIEGDQFSWKGISFEVVDMDGFRVDKVLVDPKSMQPKFGEDAEEGD